VRVRDVIALQKFEIFRIRNRDEHILACDAKRFLQDRFDRRNVLDDFKEQNRIETLVRKWKESFSSNHGQAGSYASLEILKVDVAPHARSSFFSERETVSTVATPEIENLLPRMPRRETHESSVVFASLCRKARLIDVVTRAQHGPAIINAGIAMRHRILLAASLLYLCAANIVWIAIDTRPPFWDMANHANWSLGVLRDFQYNGVAAFMTLPQDSGSYPPLYYAVTAIFYALLGPTIDAAQFANLPAIILLGLATYGIARFLMEPGAAVLAAVIANFIPLLLWLSRETMLEYWLTAMVAVSIWVLLQSRDFSNQKWTLVFGICCGLGMLTKWTFAIFVAFPAIWAARKHPGNALKSAAIAAVVASYWYIPQFYTMPQFWRQNAAAAAFERDPSAILQSILFYIRAFEGSVLFLPLFLFTVAGILLVVRNWRTSFPKWTPLALCLIGSACGLMLLPSTDPRYAVGILPVVAVFAAAPFEKRATAQMVLVGFLVFQHVLVSFGIPQLPERIVLIKGTDGPLPFDWNLYSQSYFNLWGKPERQDWHIEDVLKRVSAGATGPVRLGLIPDLPRLDVQAYQFAIDLHGYPVKIDRQVAPDEKSLILSDYLLMSVGRQTAFGSQAPHAEEINAFIESHPEQFRLVDSFSIPSGETVRLYECLR
jgi:hypothetical protein